MNKLVKRLVSGALSLVLVGALSVSAFAVGGNGSYNDDAQASNVEVDYSLNKIDVPAGKNFDLVYSWDRALTWTYITDGTNSGWYHDTSVTGLTDSGKRALLNSDITSEDETATAKRVGVLFVIGNKSADYTLTYSMVDSNSSGKLKFAEINSSDVTGTTYDSVDASSISGATSGISSSTIAIGTGTETNGSMENATNKYAMVYPTGSVDGETTGKVTISFTTSAVIS